MAKGSIVLIPDVGGFCSSTLDLIEDVSKEAEQILPIFSGYNSPKDFLEEVLGYSVDAHTEAAYLVPLNNARLDAVGKMLSDDNISLLGPNATEKQIKDVVALLKTEKTDIEHQIKAELDNFADGSIAYSKKDLTSAIHAATAQQIPHVVPPHLIDKYRDKLDDIAAYLDDGDSPLSKSSLISLIKNEAGNVELSEYVHKGLPIAVGIAVIGYALNEIFGSGASSLSKEVVYDSNVQYDDLVVGVNDTSNSSSDQIVQDENMPDWLIEKKNLLGKSYFEIDRDKLPIEGAGLKLVEGNNDIYDDGVMKPNDGVREMMTGIDAENNNLVLVMDQDAFYKDSPIAEPTARFSNNDLFSKIFQLKEMDFTEVAPGIFYTKYQIDDNEEMCFVGKDVVSDIEEFEILPTIVYKKQ